MSNVINFLFKNLLLDVLEMECSWTGPPSKKHICSAENHP